MTSVDTIIQSAKQLPPFPAVIHKALNLINNPNVSVQEVVETIQYDQAITANVLRICNSAQYGLRQPISSLQDALLFLGFNQLFAIIDIKIIHCIILSLFNRLFGVISRLSYIENNTNKQYYAK